jgi:uncharacterized protein YhbP (UPF0306 family)
MKTVKTIIVEHLRACNMLQLATAVDNSSWCCTVYYVVDEALNFYWISIPDRRHSLEIEQNPKTSIAVAVAHTPGQAVVGIQAEGLASKVIEQDEITRAIELYAATYKTGGQWREDFMAGKNEHIVYKFKPANFVLYDEVNFPSDTRKEWKVPAF